MPDLSAFASVAGIKIPDLSAVSVPMQFMPSDDKAMQGGMVALLGVGLGALLVSEFAGLGKTTQPAAPPTDQTNPYRSNPFRGNQTVKDIEKALLLKPSSYQRDEILKELARYPETMPIANLPEQAIALIAG
ncbi:hypothetical protein V2H45_05880 [Tumidithrix elongata RA019]|uniref:Uncharacterized protein n=2 Tax=Tumidithrix TaxID=3088355 RepID=A0AAW9PR54_9CYAN|nr:hypothetical protein [Tumidithrix elongata RA019]